MCEFKSIIWVVGVGDEMQKLLPDEVLELTLGWTGKNGGETNKF